MPRTRFRFELSEVMPNTLLVYNGAECIGTVEPRMQDDPPVLNIGAEDAKTRQLIANQVLDMLHERLSVNHE